FFHLFIVFPSESSSSAPHFPIRAAGRRFPAGETYDYFWEPLYIKNAPDLLEHFCGKDRLGG
ncbi:MAG: hypothetical protein LBS89_07295, partial [Zoogloeaceae bacterium]|nr:hypothetical protein [Zoogloeaceae bacterium]